VGHGGIRASAGEAEIDAGGPDEHHLRLLAGRGPGAAHDGREGEILTVFPGFLIIASCSGSGFRNQPRLPPDSPGQL
jgi:hypothetical protein